MKPKPITSQEGKNFLDVFDGSTRSTYKSGLGVFLIFYGKNKTLTDFLDALEEDSKCGRRERKWIGRKTLRDFSRWLQKHDYKPKAVRTYISSVQSLATYHGYNITTRYSSLPTSLPVSQKYPWTVNEAYEFIRELPTVEMRSIATTTLQSGLGPADILKLTYNDIKIEYEKGVVPLCFDFGRKKTDIPFMTFIGKMAVSVLREHLKGKKLKLTTLLYTVEDRKIRYHFQQLGKRKLGEYIGWNPCRLYSLRSAFRTLLGDAGLSQDYVEFFMGHHVPEQRRVYVSKTRNGWRETYKKYEAYLTPENYVS